MRPALFALAAATGLFALGNGPCGTTAVPVSAAPVVRPAVLTTVERCSCLSGGECTCEDCLCGKVVEAPKPTITPVKATTTIPPGYVCGPNGCYPASGTTYASGSCASGSCASYGGGERRGMFGRWYPGRRVVGLFRRRR